MCFRLAIDMEKQLDRNAMEVLLKVTERKRCHFEEVTELLLNTTRSTTEEGVAKMNTYALEMEQKREERERLRLSAMIPGGAVAGHLLFSPFERNGAGLAEQDAIRLRHSTGDLEA